MNIIIIGCDKVGFTLAEMLDADGNNVTVVDIDADKVKDVANKLDIMGIVGNGATHTTQLEAGIKKADLLIAVTGSDELNLLCCIMAKRESNCHTIARLENPEYKGESNYIKNELGLAMVINPELAAAEEIARILRFPSALNIDTFAGGRVELIKFKLPEKSILSGLSVKYAAGKLGNEILFCTVERGDDAYIPHGDFVFESKDIISIIASPKAATAFFKKIGFRSESVKDVIVAGGGKISEYLCKTLARTSMNIKIIEKDRQKCEELSNSLIKVTVVNGDPRSKDVMLEEGISRADAFVALTGDDEENILLSLFAKREGVGKLITKINRVDYDDVIRPLELDSTIYPKSVTAEQIVRYARSMKSAIGSKFETMYTVMKGRVEAAEFKINEPSSFTGKPISTLSLKKGVLIAAILRDKFVIIPRGNDTIEVGDAVVVVCETTTLRDISDILR
ncbi:MAG: Trk system potassium transporter TrkA [Clostridia bacterium]|nr:Trk system potassium transporter TrkA [Clostridia bacterium]